MTDATTNPETSPPRGSVECRYCGTIHGAAEAACPRCGTASCALDAEQTIYSEDIASDKDPWATWVGQQTPAQFWRNCDSPSTPRQEAETYVRAVTDTQGVTFTPEAATELVAYIAARLTVAARG